MGPGTKATAIAPRAGLPQNQKAMALGGSPTKTTRPSPWGAPTKITEQSPAGLYKNHMPVAIPCGSSAPAAIGRWGRHKSHSSRPEGGPAEHYLPLDLVEQGQAADLHIAFLRGLEDHRLERQPRQRFRVVQVLNAGGDAFVQQRQVFVAGQGGFDDVEAGADGAPRAVHRDHGIVEIAQGAGD